MIDSMKTIIHNLFTITWIRILVIDAAAVAIGIFTEALSSRLGASGGIDWHKVPSAWEFWAIVSCVVIGIFHQVVGAVFDSHDRQRFEAKVDQILANTTPPPEQPQPVPEEITVQSAEATVRFSKAFDDSYAKLDRYMQAKVGAVLQKVQQMKLNELLSSRIVHRVKGHDEQMYVLRVNNNYRILFTVGREADEDYILLNSLASRDDILK